MKKLSLSLSALVVVSAIACQAKSAPPLFVDPKFNPAVVDRIDVFVVDPAHDVANDRECMAGVKVGSAGSSRVLGSLARRGYNTEGTPTEYEIL